jgi:hypothetical protein
VFLLTAGADIGADAGSVEAFQGFDQRIVILAPKRSIDKHEEGKGERGHC